MKKTLFILLIAALAINTTTAQQFAGELKNYSIVQNEKLFGIINNQTGDTLQPCKYNYICPSYTFAQGFITRQGDSCLILDPINNKFLKPNQIVKENSSNLYAFPLAINDKYGFVNGDGKVIIEGKWDYASDFNNSMARVVDNDGVNKNLSSLLSFPSAGKTGYIDTLGSYIIPPNFSYIDFFPSQTYRITRFTRAKYLCTNDDGCENPYKTGKWGLIDNKGKIVLEADSYDFIDRGFIDDKTQDLIFMVEKDGKKGIVNYQGTIVYPLKKHSSFEELWTSYRQN